MKPVLKKLVTLVIPKGHKFRLSRQAAQLSFKANRTVLNKIGAKAGTIRHFIVPIP